MATSFSKVIRKVRPDRPDLRDRPYQPKLVNLPPASPDPKLLRRWVPLYRRLILNQGKEGACTGFGLAAVINYLIYRETSLSGRKFVFNKVSAAMLYRLARQYDEWKGEDYEGSSCRGAMKGWHKHGVCSWKAWPHREGDPDGGPTGRTWETEAAAVPLGAYFRVEKTQINDLQSAIHEVGAVFVSADVHTGWDEVETRRTKRVADLPVIPFDKVKLDGAHAFALVGYTPEGFIVQNSWGPDWGHNGFAVMRYEDWLKNGTDAWVAVMGAPRLFQVTPGAYATAQRPALAARGTGAAATIAGAAKDLHPGVWDDATVLRHTIILGNNGRAERRNIAHRDGAEAVHSVAHDALLAWAKSRSGKTVKLALYAHGGLNSEASSLKRVAVLGPWFEANGVFPVFFTWRTGAKETILSMLEDALPKFLRAEPDFTPAGGVGDWFKRQLEKLKERSVDAMDYAVEGACREFLVRGGWSEMKENAAGASDIEGGGLALTVAGLKKVADALAKAGRKLEIHLAGHSAGSILHGHLGGVLMGAGLTVSSCHLYAAACTVDFANASYFMRRGPGAVFDAAKCEFHVHHLSEKAERDDTVGPVYRKSLLYLICRALETWHKTPLLGMEAVWNPAHDAKKVFNKLWTGPGKAIAWLRANSAGITQHIYDTTHKVSDGETTKPPTHGAFDNDCAVLNHTLGVIAGQPLTRQVTWLAGY